jgi:hypothetical protein
LGVGGDVRLVVDPGQSVDCPRGPLLRLKWVVSVVSCGGHRQAGGVQDGEEVVVERAAS